MFKTGDQESGLEMSSDSVSVQNDWWEELVVNKFKKSGWLH
jgi:hypothetical protein